MKQIQDYFILYKQAAWNKDIEGMTRLYDGNVVIYDMWTKGYQIGITEWAKEIHDWLSSLGEENVNVIFEMVAIHESGNVGFANAVITYQAISTDNTILRSMKNRITIGFHKPGSDWKVIHQHTSAPINGELQAILNF